MRSDIAWSSQTEIRVHGYDLAEELIGSVDLGGMAFLELTGRLPTEQESAAFNACLVSMVEHGITPNVIAARLTMLGAPEALQGAVAAGLLGAGDVFLGTTEGSARMLQVALEQAGRPADLEAIAQAIVAGHRGRQEAIPGIGHPLHRPVDPRATRLLRVAREQNVANRHVALLELIQAEAEKVYARELPVNVTGAVGAIISDIGLPWQIARGFGLMSRVVGLVAHLLEESRMPMATTIWRQTDTAATQHLRDAATTAVREN